MTQPARGPKRILVVEDEPNISQTLRYNLTREGYEVSEAATGTAAIELARQRHPDLILLDLMLPELSGLEVCRILRQEMTTPILILTAKGAEIDKVVGLQIGADDYVTKPFSLRELLARITALLRRVDLSGREVRKGKELEVIGNFRMDRGARTVHVDGQEVRLAPKEFDLLSFLLAHAGKVQSREFLIQQVWGSNFYGDRKTVDVHVRWLREKIEIDPNNPRHIITVRSRGYMFRE